MSCINKTFQFLKCGNEFRKITTQFSYLLINNSKIETERSLTHYTIIFRVLKIHNLKKLNFENCIDRYLIAFIFVLLAKPTIKKFGFHVETSCGKIPQNNKWTDDWIV